MIKLAPQLVDMVITYDRIDDVISCGYIGVYISVRMDHNEFSG